MTIAEIDISLPPDNVKSNYVTTRISQVLNEGGGLTLQDAIKVLDVSKVTALKWLRMMEEEDLVSKSCIKKAGKGRPKNIYHPTRKLVNQSINVANVVISFPTLKSICKYEDLDACMISLSELQRCEKTLCPYMRTDDVIDL